LVNYLVIIRGQHIRGIAGSPGNNIIGDHENTDIRFLRCFSGAHWQFFWDEAQTFFPYLTITTIIYRERRTSTEESSGRPSDAKIR